MARQKTFRVNDAAPNRKRRQGIQRTRSDATTNRRKRSIASSLPLLSLWLVAIGFVSLLAWEVAPGSDPTAQTSPRASITNSANPNNPSTTLPARQLPPAAVSRPTSLEAAVKGTLTKWKADLGTNAQVSLVVHNIETGEKVAMDSQHLLESASLYKLFVMLAVYYDIEGGSLNLEDEIKYAPDSTALDDDGYLLVPIGQMISVRDLLRVMIVDSNNTASLTLLFQVVKPARMRAIATELGFTGSNLTDTFSFRTTSQDIDLFFTRLAQQNLLGPKYDQAMLELLSQTNIRDRIPALLPAGTRVANKTGDLAGVVNDAGIIYLPNGNQVAVVVITSQVNDGAARKFIAELSLATYNYYAGATT